FKALGEMAEETQPEAAAEAEVVVTEPAPAPAEAEVPAAADAEAVTETEKKADEPAVTADDAGKGTGSFKEESNLVEDLPDPEKKVLDEFKHLIAAALAAGEFNLPPPPPPPKAKEEPKAEETKTEESKTEDPAEEEPKAESAAEEPKAEVAANAPDEEVKTEVPPVEEAKAETVAVEAKPAEPEPQEKTVVVAEEEPATKTVEAIEESVVSADEAAAPEPVLVWGVPLVGDDERTDTVLLKFLRAREFKVKEAMAMLKSAVLWRKRFGITSLLDADLGLPELENVVFYRGADREGHPVCYNVYGEFQDKDLYEKAFGDDEKRERFLKWRIQLLERGILSKLDFSPNGICSMVQVTDLKNSPPMLGKHRAVTRQAVTLLQDNYPEFIAKKVFINVPWWYLAANKMMSPFFTQRTKSKFVFASPAKSAETLFRYIAPEQVPVQFGGLFKEDDPEFTTLDTVTELTIKPSSKETIEIPVTE
ncbi:hypothetical protein ACJX0J_035782, partial [Zea mays]